MEPVGLDLGGNINYLQDLAVTADGSNLLDIIDQNVPGYHRVTKTDPFQDPTMEDEPFCCMHRHHLLTSACGGGGGGGGGLGSMTSAMCETASLDLSPNITEDFQRMYNDWQQHLGSLQASEEEDLVVDEVISLSVDSINRKSASIAHVRPRQRTESVSSITGPCVPPDLLLDTGMQQDSDDDYLDEVQEEDVLTEIAGVLDGDLPLEDSLIIADDGIFGTTQVKVESNDIKLEEDDEVDIFEDDIDDVVEGFATAPIIHLENEHLSQGEVAPSGNGEELQNGGGFRNVAELVGKKTEGLVCQEIKSKKTLPDKFRFDGKDVKLPAGSIILAVVNESGSLVPLPQMQMRNKNLVNALTSEDSPEKCIEEEIDVETVTEKTPVLEAGDVDSLLAQFEASEAVNTSRRGSTMIKETSCIKPEVVPASSVKSSQQSASISHGISPDKSPQASATHQKIRDSLPKEIIEKIKASAKRKSTQMLSEPLVVLKGRGVKQQEANQHRSKAHRSQSQASVQQTSVDQRVPPPLDHDYCFSPDKQKKNKCSEINASQSEDYLNKLPDYYTERVSKSDNAKKILQEDIHDESGKKDSGVESGDVSDASVETEDRRKERTNNIEHCEEKVSEVVYNKLPPYMTDIGNAKAKVESKVDESIENKECKPKEEKAEEKKIKRKLNLSEYRKRIQSAQSSRCPSPAQTDTSKTSSCEPLSIGELIQKMKEAEEAKAKESAESIVPEKKADPSLPPADMEEGELQGDSDPEMLNSNTSVQDSSNIAKPTDIKNEKVSLPFTSPASLSNSANRDSQKSKSLGYTSRRWSSSSRSRSRSRSPSDSRKRHTSHSSRSSRGRRRRPRKSSGSSVSTCRSWSRSRSRSRGRGSSESSYCSSCSCSSKSRSRSRSHSARRRDRKGYSRRYSGNRERRRRSCSRSRSSLRYERVTRSRSPRWRESKRSRSPPTRRSIRPLRKEDDNRIKEVEERRVIYVGRISEGTTKVELRRRFQKFGVIVDISVHFREHGDNYGFVTFKNKDEAYNAVEHGNDDPSYPRYDLCFGGRRAFCRVQYSDLDAQDDEPFYRRKYGGPLAVSSASADVDFDSLLRAAMKRKTR